MDAFKAVSSWRMPTLLGGLALAVGQVSLGLLFKFVQRDGSYPFSTSGALLLSEALLLISYAVVYACLCFRARRDGGQYAALQEDVPPPLEDLEDVDINSDRKDVEMPSASGTWSSLRGELSKSVVFASAYLALLQTLANNLTFLLYRLADPGTINLLGSGVMVATAVTSMLFFAHPHPTGQRRWLSILVQLAGLVMSQYDLDTGAVYPLQTYAAVLGHVSASAIAHDVRMQLSKTDNETCAYARSIVLHAFGVLTNGLAHLSVSLKRADEPGLFQGYWDQEAGLVILGLVINLLLGRVLAKSTDATARWVSMAISTSILLYLSSLVFQVRYACLVIPGAVIAWTGGWAYIETAPPRTAEHDHAASTEPGLRECVSGRLAALSSTGANLVLYGSTIAFAVAVVSGMTALTGWDITQLQLTSTKTTMTKLDPETKNNPATSPFANTMGFMRMNPALPERLPLLEKYAPFFHMLHYSLPPDMDNWTPGDFVNLTHSGWGNHMNVYMPVAQVMSLILADETLNTTIEGLFNFHFDVWVNPMEFAYMDFSRLWFPHGRDTTFFCSDETNGPTNQWEWWVQYDLWNNGVKSLNSLDGTKFAVDKLQVCQGWSDIYYVPRRHFEDFIFLAERWDPQFHETAVPTIMNVLDHTYKKLESRSPLMWLSDCWGTSVTANPPLEAVMYQRCGHRFPMADANLVNAHFERIDRLAANITTNGERTVPGTG